MTIRLSAGCAWTTAAPATRPCTVITETLHVTAADDWYRSA
jgi:hypothetical protein